MTFDAILGNDLVKSYLSNMVAKGALANSLLFCGEEGVGKSLFAEALAELLLGSKTHPDFHIYKPEGKLGLHSIQALRQFSEEVYMAPFQGKRKLFAIHDAERMLPASANALLKTFEEPPSDTIIILISSSPAALIPTILSRCRKIHFQAVPEREIARFLTDSHGSSADDAARLARLSNGAPGRALRLMQQQGNPAQEALIALLAQGKKSTYKELTESIRAIAAHVEASKKLLEEEAKQMTQRASNETLTAVQKEALQKEIDGALAMKLAEEASALFQAILAWHRDLELLAVGGAAAHLIHADRQDELNAALRKAQRPTLEQVEEAVAESRLALQRSTALENCLETLLIKLNYV